MGKSRIVMRWCFSLAVIAACCTGGIVNASDEMSLSIDPGKWVMADAEVPKGNVLKLHADNPGYGVGHFKQMVEFPVTNDGLAPGEYTITFVGNITQQPSQIWIGLRGSSNHVNSFRNTLGGESWKFLPLNRWSSFTVPLVVRSEGVWKGRLEFEVLLYGADGDATVQSEIYIAGASLRNAEGLELLTSASVAFAADTLGNPPQTLRVGSDIRKDHPGFATAEVVAAASAP